MKQLRPVDQCPTRNFYFGKGGARRPVGAPTDARVWDMAALNTCEEVLTKIRPLLRTEGYLNLGRLAAPGGARAAAQLEARARQMALLVAAGLPDVIGPQVLLDFSSWEDGVEPLFPKICSWCRMSYSKSAVKCLQAGCREEHPHSSLPLIDEMRKRYGKRDGAMHFRSTNKPLHRVSQGSMLHTVNAAGLIQSRLLETRSTEETALGSHTSVGVEGPESSLREHAGEVVAALAERSSALHHTTNLEAQTASQELLPRTLPLLKRWLVRGS
jgi:hypothetical protein